MADRRHIGFRDRAGLEVAGQAGGAGQAAGLAQQIVQQRVDALEAGGGGLRGQGAGGGGQGAGGDGGVLGLSRQIP